METIEDLDLLIAKVKDIAGGPDGDLLRKLVDILHERGELQGIFDEEPLSPEALAAVQEAEEAIRRGDMSQFTSLEEYERKRGL
jgi:hypothetical protein